MVSEVISGSSYAASGELLLLSMYYVLPGA